MLTRQIGLTVGIAMALTSCGDQRSPAGRDGAAVAACRSLLGQVADQERLATTVREEEPGFVIRAWTSGRAEGQPDYLCRVTRDESAERGVRVVTVESQDGTGGYQSRLDIQIDAP